MANPEWDNYHVNKLTSEQRMKVVKEIRRKLKSAREHLESAVRVAESLEKYPLDSQIAMNSATQAEQAGKDFLEIYGLVKAIRTIDYVPSGE